MNRVWLTISSIVLACSFVFGNSIRNVFESVVFLFVVHPFDVGDALLVADPQDSAAGPQYHLVGPPPAFLTLSPPPPPPECSHVRTHRCTHAGAHARTAMLDAMT